MRVTENWGRMASWRNLSNLLANSNGRWGKMYALHSSWKALIVNEII